MLQETDDKEWSEMMKQSLAYPQLSCLKKKAYSYSVYDTTWYHICSNIALYIFLHAPIS